MENIVGFENIEKLYFDLTDYAQYHFKTEEDMMMQTGIDHRHYVHHVEAHRNFLDEVISMHSNISNDNPATARHLLEFLTQWLIYHILGEDQIMARQIEAIQSGMNPGKAYEMEERERDSATETLLTALDKLFQLVSFRNKELKQLNLSLEEKVAIRTRELHEAILQFEKISSTDVLTGLPNRRHAMKHLANLWRESRNTNASLVVMMVDADHFKEINDTFGHDAGDKVLVELSRTLQHSMRNDDLVCRLGGDEFLIICHKTDHAGGMHIAELMHENVSKLRVATGGKLWHGSICVGVAACKPDKKNYEEIIKEADKAVYLAKQGGKNCVRTTG